MTDDNGYILISKVQLAQLGKKCSMCEEKAKFFDTVNEEMPSYCDRHFPGNICQCEVCIYNKSN